MAFATQDFQLVANKALIVENIKYHKKQSTKNTDVLLFLDFFF